ncbi:maleylacetate reductase [Palleronia sediminis]|uniref:Maleylacetate reductase n=1 Tax=Palleronia sediminis TaxID=2547833 RepID=A0A4R6A6H2_9RHOB|nr:maleylacetate reductase [Palleronia sediminis]TDL79321.1 maleylacetate reductase [Palleronia sediminis]
MTTEQRVRFGAGLRHEAGDEVERLGCARALILSTPHQAELAMDLAADIGAHCAGLFTGAAMHTPVEVTQAAMAHAQETEADCLVSVGGGSTIGLGKAIALRTDLPQVAIPTTYAGSEATPILGQTENGAKTTLTDPRVRPETVLYDAELVATLPAAMTVTSALNAMAHAVEALYARDRDEDTDALAMEGLRAFVDGLAAVVETPGDLAARETTQRGAWACGAVLGRSSMALHHKLCHTLGGMLGLPHAETHAVVLPHAVAYNMGAAARELAPVAELLGGDDPARALWDFAGSLDAPRSLRGLGMEEGDIDRCAAAAAANPYWNPRPVEEDAIRALLARAWAGEAPAG